MLFFLFFWMFDFVMDKSQAWISLGKQDSTMIAGALSLLVAGIPAIIYISKSSINGTHRHRHGHSHRQNRNKEVKNTNPD